MLATIAALHLVVVNQIAPPREVTPAEAVQEEPAPERGVPAPVEVTAPPETARPPAGPAPSALWSTPPAVGAPPAAPPAARPAAAPAAPDPAAPPATAYPSPPAASGNPPLPSKSAPYPWAPPSEPATADPAAPAASGNPPLPSKAAPSPYAPPAQPATAYPAAQAAPENPPLPSKAAPSPYAPPAYAPPAQPEAAQAAPPAGAEPVPLPKPPSGPALPPPPEGSRAASPPPAAAPPAPPAAAPPRMLSLLSGETLQGGSTALAWAGWAALGIAYGQGLSPKDDLGGFLDYDWAKSELVLGLAYRRSVGKAGGWDMASRLSAGYYTNLGSTLVEDENRSDRGIEVTPGLSVSRSGQAGVFSAVVEGPITVTWKYGAGLLFAPRLTLSFEAPVYHEVTVGFRAGAAYRAGAGEAPLRLGSPEFVFLVLAGYQLL